MCPLVGDPPWYDWKPSHPFDLILIDGSPGTIGRKGILRVLDDCVHETTIVVLDDTNRPAERELAEDISRRYGLQCRHSPKQQDGRSFAICQKPEKAGTTTRQDDIGAMVDSVQRPSTNAEGSLPAILRDDDVFLTASPTNGRSVYDFGKFTAAHELIRKSGRKHCLGIIAGEIENHPELVSYIRARSDEFQYAVHGWLHERYIEWPAARIAASLKRAKRKIAETVGVVPQWFFPPGNQVNDEVLVACDLRPPISSSKAALLKCCYSTIGTIEKFDGWRNG